ncbi:mitochondrial Rho GTPase 1-like protein [Tanacetum coccineum]
MCTRKVIPDNHPSAAAEKFPTNVPPVLPPTRLPEDMFPDCVPVMVIDTSSSLENRGKLAEELKKADAIVLTYALAGCKLDLRDVHQAVSMEQVMSPIVQEFPEIETCIECSAYKHMQIPEVFYYSQKAVLHPTAPLFDQEKQTLKPRCVRALKRIFILCDQDRDDALSDAELNDFQDVFPTAYCTATEVHRIEAHSKLHRQTVENLVYIGYAGDPSSARRESPDSFVGRPFSQVYTPTTEERYTVNMVDQPGGTKKTLILKEIPEDAIEKLLVKKEALGTCDVAVFVHDSSKEASWIRATELLVQVASHGESNGYEVPCLIVAAKDDLEPYPNAVEALTGVSQDMGIQAPIPICTKLGGFNNVFKRTVAAAEHPHLSIPETEAGKTRKWYYSIRRDPIFFSFRLCLAKRSSNA